MPTPDSHIKFVGYIIPFLLGGVTVSGIKYLSNIVGPAYAALLGALPI